MGAVGFLSGCGRDPTIDVAVVGSYDFTVPGGRWRLTIAGDGTYSFVNEAGGTAPSHSGTFSTNNGEWSMQATTMELADGGTYRVAPAGVELTGNRGAWYWSRSSDLAADAVTAPAGASTPDAIPVAAPGVASSAPAAIPAARSTDTIDPCLLVTETEAASLLGAGVSREASTPQPRTQNDCLYRVRDTTNRTLAVHAYNGNGIDPNGYLERRRNSGGQPLPGVGDGALITYRDVTGLTSVDFVLGRTTVEILVSGVPRERADPVLRSFAAQAVSRLTSGAAAFRMPGRERFVGTWLVSGAAGADRMVITVAPDGAAAVESSLAFGGTMLLDGARWRVEDGLNATPPSGEYRLSGERLTLTGASLAGELTRVACRTPPKRIPPSILTRDVANYLNGTNLARLQLRTGGTTSFDPRLGGLWEGTLTSGSAPMPALVSLDQNGRGAFSLFPLLRGRLDAADGGFRLALDGFGETVGTYRFNGGINEGLIETVDAEDTLTWSPYDATAPASTPAIVGHCY